MFSILAQTTQPTDTLPAWAVQILVTITAVSVILGAISYLVLPKVFAILNQIREYAQSAKTDAAVAQVGVDLTQKSIERQSLRQSAADATIAAVALASPPTPPIVLPSQTPGDQVIGGSVRT